MGTIERGICERTDFELDCRAAHPDGTIKYVHTLGHPVLNPSGDLVEFVGTSIDMTERRRAEEARLDAQNQLAHANRVTAMGQLAASIAHEVNQPIAATVTNAEAALRWLDRRPPDLEEVRQTLACIAKDGNRAAEVIDEIRALIKKAPPRKDRLEINGAIREVIGLTRGEVVKNGVWVHAELAEGLPLIQGDRVQLQQVILNLVINSVEAMSGVGEGARELLISTGKAEPDSVLVAVRDSGPGLAPATLERLFEVLLHDQAERFGAGAVDLPFDHRSPRRTIMGLRERAPRRGVSIHSACPARYWVVIAGLSSILRPVPHEQIHVLGPKLKKSAQRTKPTVETRFPCAGYGNVALFLSLGNHADEPPRKAATGQARGCLHCGGQRFESPPLHQEVRAFWHDFLRHRIARHSRGLRRQQSVC